MKFNIDKDFLTLWIKELRSGKYSPGVGYLYSNENEGKDYYCCLGVACKMLGADNESLIGVHYIVDSVLETFPGSSDKIPDCLVKHPSNLLPRFLAEVNDCGSVDSANFDNLFNVLDCKTLVGSYLTSGDIFNDIADFLELNFNKLTSDEEYQ